MTEKDIGQIDKPAQREKALVDASTLESYKYVAGQLTEKGIGAYLVMPDSQVEQVNPDKVSIIVVTPHRRSDAFWETVHGLTRELRHVTAERISEVRQNFVAGKIARIKADASVSGSNPYILRLRAHPLR